MEQKDNKDKAIFELKYLLCMKKGAIMLFYSECGNKKEADDLLQRINSAIYELNKETPDLQKASGIFNEI